MADRQLHILYFAWVREKIGLSEEWIPAPTPDVRIMDLVALLTARSNGHAEAFADHHRIRAAVDQVFVPLDTPLGDARELALFPPVTGG